MRRTYFAVGLIIGILSASLSAQTAEVSVSNRYVPDLSLFSTPKKRKPLPGPK